MRARQRKGAGGTSKQTKHCSKYALDLHGVYAQPLTSYAFLFVDHVPRLLKCSKRCFIQFLVEFGRLSENKFINKHYHLLVNALSAYVHHY
jgi:hypothetical protein